VRESFLKEKTRFIFRACRTTRTKNDPTVFAKFLAVRKTFTETYMKLSDKNAIEDAILWYLTTLKISRYDTQIEKLLDDVYRATDTDSALIGLINVEQIVQQHGLRSHDTPVPPKFLQLTKRRAEYHMNFLSPTEKAQVNQMLNGCIAEQRGGDVSMPIVIGVTVGSLALISGIIAFFSWRRRKNDPFGDYAPPRNPSTYQPVTYRDLPFPVLRNSSALKSSNQLPVVRSNLQSSNASELPVLRSKLYESY
jgi:hypothetical protein